MRMSGCAALVLAGGSGTRLGAETPKQYLTIGGRAILRHSVEAFLRHPAVDVVHVVVRREDQDRCNAALAGLRLGPPVPGGATRQESARRGLESLATFAPDRVLIHDAARPFVAADVIDRVLAALADYPGAIPALPLSDTVKRGDPSGARVAGTLDRSGLWRAQTPQAFRYADILAAHRTAAGLQLTDDAAVAETAGLAVGIVPGDEENIKVTTKDDLDRARRLYEGGTADLRVGNGFDVHPFDIGDHVTLCGVRIPFGRGLKGHSDADVGLHAITDAILGATANGDIGTHFPPSDARWRNADSAIFLRHAADLVASKGGAVVHVDVTLVCEEPRISPHRDAMVARVAEILGIGRDRVSVKATTTEKLGFIGRREGIAAQATATVRLPSE
jgi:2-C-methyl-D-erythritol 4-phosphate cytidylyltransferase/2-C-methyl-D-erythritol 2,4-cyclodiphosphate synthase